MPTNACGNDTAALDEGECRFAGNRRRKSGLPTNAGVFCNIGKGIVSGGCQLHRRMLRDYAGVLCAVTADCFLTESQSQDCTSALYTAGSSDKIYEGASTFQRISCRSHNIRKRRRITANAPPIPKHAKPNGNRLRRETSNKRGVKTKNAPVFRHSGESRNLGVRSSCH